MLKHILIAFCFILPCTVHAQAVKPQGALTATIPDYNITIGIWAVDTPVGGYVELFTLQGNQWFGCDDCYLSGQPEFNFDAVVNAQGAAAFVRNVVVPSANAQLARRFPPIPSGGSPAPPPPTAGGVSQVNYILGTVCGLTNANGDNVSYIWTVMDGYVAALFVLLAGCTSGSPWESGAPLPLTGGTPPPASSAPPATAAEKVNAVLAACVVSGTPLTLACG